MARTKQGEPNKRDALIDAAKVLLVERGYEAMSPKAVLRASGAGQGSLYHHFEGKCDLAASALDAIREEACAEFDAAFVKARTPLKQVYSFLDATRDALRGCRLGRLANEQAIFDPHLAPAVRGFFDHIQVELTKAVRLSQRDGELLNSLKPAEVATLLITAVQGGYVLSRIHNDPAQLTTAISAAKAQLKALHPR